jgi:endonuclease G
MDFQRVLADTDLRDELLQRVAELADAAPGSGLETLDGGIGLADVASTAEAMSAGDWDSSDTGLEAIIQRFTRPVLLIQQGKFTDPPDTFPNSEHLAGLLAGARAKLEAVIPSVGRVEVRNHRNDWLGTGWMVAEDTVVTNSHVAEEFARQDGTTFPFRKAPGGGRSVRASLDWVREFDQPEESVVQVEKVLWIEPDDSVDVALLRTRRQGDEGQALPPVINLMTQQELDEAGVEDWICVIGYPAYDSRNNAQDQQRLFDGIYNVKRLAPGQVLTLGADGVLSHDATTLGGNSGSAVISLRTGKAAGLHFGGIEGDRNQAVQGPRLADIVRSHA